jgi:hypothetical protein
VENKDISEEQILYELIEAARQVATPKKGKPLREKTSEGFIEERNKLQLLVDSLDC